MYHYVNEEWRRGHFESILRCAQLSGMQMNLILQGKFMSSFHSVKKLRRDKDVLTMTCDLVM